MKITVEQKDLAALLSRVVSTVEKRNVIPILANVLLSTDEGIITVTATDLDMAVRSQCAATIEKHGAVTFNAAMAASIVGKLPKGRLITISYDDRNVTISSGSASFDLASLPADEFPELANAEYQSSFTAPASDLKRLLDLSAFAMSSESTRYYLCGVYFHPNEQGMVRAVTTDGHRLARIDSEIKAEFPGVILPSKFVAEIRKQLSEGDVTVSVSSSKIKFDMGDTVMTTKVIEGVFPDYSRVIPQGNNIVVTADADDMKAASDLVALVSGERTKGVRMAFKDGQCDMEVNGANNEKGKESVDIEKEGDDIVIGLNSRYAADVLSHVIGDKVVMRFGGSGDPCVVQPADDLSALWVIMPMRVA